MKIRCLLLYTGRKFHHPPCLIGNLAFFEAQCGELSNLIMDITESIKVSDTIIIPSEMAENIFVFGYTLA